MDNFRSVRVTILGLLALGVLGLNSVSSQDCEQTIIWTQPHHQGQLDVREIQRHLGLGRSDVLKLMHTEKDTRGAHHKYFQHFHKGFRVVGSQVIAHEKERRTYLINGRLSLGIDINTVTNPNTRGEHNELVILGPHLSSGTSYEVATVSDYGRGGEVAYIDIQSGEELLTLNQLRSCGSKGTANTRFNGEVEITTEAWEGAFRLREVRKDVSIKTLNAQRIHVDTLVDNLELYKANGVLADFLDEDNYWDNFNEQLDELATDIHWGTERTFDYFHDVHGRLGMDGTGGELLSIVHIGDDWDDAFYLPPPYNFMGYGDGGLLATLDVVAHEVTHGVVRFSAALLYINESSILDESFADIFSAAVKFHNDTPYLNEQWELAEQLGTFRSLKSPKSYGQPDTYKGQFWYTGNSRPIFAHQNNGVPNYWFYLLTEGGTGVNDRGESYFVDGVGLEKAEQITYRTLNTYLTNTAALVDARLGSIQSAIDLYGEGWESEQVSRAWDAVGVKDLVAGIDEGNNTANFSIYPSHTTHMLYLHTPQATNQLSISCQEISGRTTYTWLVDEARESEALELDVSRFTEGVYVLTVESAAGTYTARFVKQ